MSKLGLLAEPARTPRVEINLNAGPKMDYHLSFDPASKPAHCFVLDISIVGEYGLRLIGPPAREVFAPIPRSWLQEALEDSRVARRSRDTPPLQPAERLPVVALRQGGHYVLEGRGCRVGALPC
jgi:hypothetical protein